MIQLSTNQVAERYGFHVDTIRGWRATAKGPKWTKSGRYYRYSMRDLLSWEKDYGAPPVGQLDIARFSWLIRGRLKKGHEWKTLAAFAIKGRANMCLEALEAHYPNYIWKISIIGPYG